MSRIEMAVLACCLLVVGVGFGFFPIYYAVRSSRRRRRRQARSFLEVIGKASAAPTASEHPPLITVGSDPRFNPPRAAADEPHESTQPSRVGAA